MSSRVLLELTLKVFQTLSESARHPQQFLFFAEVFAIVSNGRVFALDGDVWVHRETGDHQFHEPPDGTRLGKAFEQMIEQYVFIKGNVLLFFQTFQTD